MNKICLCLHGFTGGPFELEPLAEHLRALGWQCRIPELPGHGEQFERIGKVRWQDWIRAADDNARSIAEQYGMFDLVGFSMGGMISAHIASKYPVRRLVLLNAAAIYVSPGRFIRELGLAMKNRNWARFKKMKATPLRATLQFVQLVRYARPLLRNIRIPTLVAQAGQDAVVHPISAKYVASKIKGPVQVRYFPHSSHLICLDCEADQLFREVVRFLTAEAEEDC